jgi:hypothetical protein
MTTSNFPSFAKLVADGFQNVVRRASVFVVGLDPDVLYVRYLNAFPAGTNPIFTKNSWHDCSCCRQFIRRAGHVVAVDEGRVLTVWDGAAEESPYPYNLVAATLREAVLAAPISDLFRVERSENGFGMPQTRSLISGTQTVQTWNHLHTGAIPVRLKVDSPDQARGDYRTTVQVFTRGLLELAPGAVETVRELIEANSLYRGEEHKPALLAFQKAQETFRSLWGRAQLVFVWTNAHGPAARFRNTVIGTLVQDLSEGRDLEQAVASFESKVAPQNYKRPNALITPGMVKQAMETIESLGLEPALERRFARLSDVSVNDVKWVDGSVKPLMKGGLGEALMQHAVAVNPKRTEGDEARAEPISLDDFTNKILPETTSMDLQLSSSNLANLMVLTAPVHPEPKQLFRWNNDFAWSYGGNVTDSIRERVKKAGGRVDGAVLRVSLSWFNYDDLDLHVQQPSSPARFYRDEICYSSKQGWTGGVLDVDMNAGGGTTREPVENIVWARNPPDGIYRAYVNNFRQRETSNPGFVVEVESSGKLFHYSYNRAVRDRQDVEVVKLHLKNGAIEHVEVGEGVALSNISQEKWGLKTETYVKVNAVTLSPNYWGSNQVGNKHTFFVLEGAVCDEPMRGIYNEFLHPRLEPHRKVFEVVGEKTKCQPTEDQIAGVGFSSTKPASFLLKVWQGKMQRLFNVQVGA